ncbi:MAG: InlB B-repeat-containing protein [Intestinibacter sp.]
MTEVKKNLKRFFSVFLSFVLCLSMMVIPTPVEAKSDTSDPVSNVFFYGQDKDGESVLLKVFDLRSDLMPLEHGNKETGNNYYCMTIDRLPTTNYCEGKGLTIPEIVDLVKSKTSVENADKLTFAGSDKISMKTTDGTSYTENYTYDDLYGVDRYYFPGLYEALKDNGRAFLTGTLNGDDNFHDDSAEEEPIYYTEEKNAVFESGEKTPVYLATSSYAGRTSSLSSFIEANNGVLTGCLKDSLDQANVLRIVIPQTEKEMRTGQATANNVRKWIYDLKLTTDGESPIDAVGTVAEPTCQFSLDGTTLTITMDCETEGAEIYHSFNGDTATSTAQYKYTEPIVIENYDSSKPLNVYMHAVKEGYSDKGTVSTTLAANSKFVNVDKALEGGTIKVSPSTANEGDVVTVTPVADKGYEYVEGSLAYTTDGENYTEITAQDGKYTFTMPSESVTVKAVFKSDGKITISTVEELKSFQEAVDKGNTFEENTIILANDIDLVNEEWTPIGGHSAKSGAIPGGGVFAGIFDGQGYTIKGMKISSVANAGYGLFGNVSGTVKNLTVEGTIASTGETGGFVGGIAGYCSGTIESCTNKVEITLTNSNDSGTGGIVGVLEGNNALVNKCANLTKVTGAGRTGGLVGALYCTTQGGAQLTNSYNTADITTVKSGKKSFSGAVAGYCKGYIKNCYTTGNMYATDGHYAAGIVGLLNGSNPSAAIENCYTAGKVFIDGEALTGENDYYKPIVSNADGSSAVKITNCYYLEGTGVQPTDSSWGTCTNVEAISTQRLATLADSLGDAYINVGEYPLLTWQVEITISTAEELKAFQEAVDNGDTFEGKFVKLTNDIDLANEEWTPIGGHSAKNGAAPGGGVFAGIFDGQGYTIKGMKISSVANAGYGLFGNVSGTVKNLTVEGTISSTGETGGFVGGIAGYCSGKVQSCTNKVEITLTNSNDSGTGGIVGVLEGNSALVNKCANLAKVTGAGRTGGLVGAIYCTAQGGAQLTNSYNVADITTVKSSSKAFSGAVAGYCKGYIKNCYTTGDMYATDGHYAASIVGLLNGRNPSAAMENCYTSGKLFIDGKQLTGEDKYYKPVVANADSSAAVIITNCYYLEGTGVQPTDSTWGTCTNVEAVTPEKLEAMATALGDAYKEGKAYPILTWQEDQVTSEKLDITFDAEDGTEPIVKKAIKGEVLDYAARIPVKEGYTFAGWYIDTDNTTTAYKSGTVYNENVTYKAKWAHVEMLGAQVKAVKNGESGIRFGTKIYDDGDKVVEKGTLMIPADLLEEGQALTLDTPKTAKSEGKVNYEVTDEYTIYLGTLVGIPEVQFDREITVAAYVVYQDKAGNEYTVYCQYPNGSTTVNTLLGQINN